MRTTIDQRRPGRDLASRTGVLLTLVALLLGLLAAPAAAADAAPTNVAPSATPEADYTASWNSLAAINDGTVGTGLNQMWGNYRADRTAQAWVSYHWDTPMAIGKSVMYFWTDAQQAGTGDHVWVPKSWKLQYKSDKVTDWTDVPGADSYGVGTTAGNVTTFPTVTVTDVRALMQADSNADGTAFSALSIPEWEVWGTKAATTPTSPTDPVAVDEVDIPTTVGTVPTLPATVGTTAKDGRRVDVPVTWPTITAAQVAQTGSFSVKGSPTGIGNTVTATVYVRAAGATPALNGFLPVSALTVVGVAPDLPPTVPATYADGSVDSRIAVTWDAVAATSYATSGLFGVDGTVAGTTLRPQVTVFVDDAGSSSTAPIVRMTTEPDQPATGWYTGAVTVKLAASSDSDPNPTIEYKVDGGDWQKATGNVVVSSDGAHTVTARATDKAGQVSKEQSVSFSVDATAPVTTPTTVDKGDAVQVTLAAADAGSGVATVQYQVGDGFVATYAGTFSVVKLDKPQTLSFFATDKAGNVEKAQTVTVPAAVATNATTTVAMLSPNSVAVGGRSTATVTVVGKGGTSPTGVVAVRAGDHELGRAPLSRGRARVTVSTLDLTPGDVPLTVDYLGDDTNAASSTTVSLKVTTAVSTTAASVSSTSVYFGSPVTVTVRTGASGVTPTGSVRVKEGDAVLATATLASGRTVVQLPQLGIGHHALTVEYAGDTRVAASKAAVVLDVVPATTFTSASLSPKKLTSRAAGTLTAKVGSSVAGVTPTGSVKVVVTRGGKTVATRTGTLNAGRSDVVLPVLPAGSYSMTVTYSGADTTQPSMATITTVVGP